MLASLQEPPVTQPGLVYEPKYDGIRAIVAIETSPRRVVLYSRNGNDKTRQFPAIAKVLGTLASRLAGPVVLDGEIVAVDRDNRPLGFQHIQGRIHRTSDGDIANAEREQPAVLVLFDILRDGAEDLRGLPLAARRLRLQERIKPRGAERDLIWLSEIALDDGRPMLQRARQEGWEGLIVKNGQSTYHSGKRTPAWRKLKILKQQEFVVGGWTEPRQSASISIAPSSGTTTRGGALRWAGHGRDRLRSERTGSSRGLLKARNRQEPVRRSVQDRRAGALGQTDTRRRDPVHGVDERRTTAAAGVSRHA
jgi:bifunctional non-homologous end joining protein LigD